MNEYAYAGGDPVNATDPTGLCDAVYQQYFYISISGGRVYGPYANGSKFLGYTRDCFQRPAGSPTGNAAASWQALTEGAPVPAVQVQPARPRVTCADNRARHEAALNRELARFEAQGFRVTRNVSFRDPASGGLRVVADAVVSTPGFPSLPLFVIDVKTGAGGRTPNQRIVYPKFGGPHELVPVGLRALQAGLVPGVRVSVQNLTLQQPQYDANGNACN